MKKIAESIPKTIYWDCDLWGVDDHPQTKARLKLKARSTRATVAQWAEYLNNAVGVPMVWNDQFWSAMGSREIIKTDERDPVRELFALFSPASLALVSQQIGEALTIEPRFRHQKYFVLAEIFAEREAAEISAETAANPTNPRAQRTAQRI